MSTRSVWNRVTFGLLAGGILGIWVSDKVAESYRVRTGCAARPRSGLLARQTAALC